jgi:hypothetical protein
MAKKGSIQRVTMEWGKHLNKKEKRLVVKVERQSAKRFIRVEKSLFDR